MVKRPKNMNSLEAGTHVDQVVELMDLQATLAHRGIPRMVSPGSVIARKPGRRCRVDGDEHTV